MFSKFITGATLATALLTANAASAELTDRLKYIKVSAEPWGIFTNHVTVQHNGEEWVESQKISDRIVSYRFKIESESTKNKYKIDHVIAGRDQFTINTYYLHYWTLSQINVYEFGKTTHYNKQEKYFFVANPKRLVNACKKNYDELRQSGLSHDEALGEDRVVRLDEKFSVAVRAKKNNELDEAVGSSAIADYAWYGRWGQKTFWNAMFVKCKASPTFSEVKGPKTPPTGPTDLKIPFTVTKINLALEQANYFGVCPYKMKLHIAVHATEAGTAKVRLYRDGAASPVYTIPITRMGNKFMGRKTVTATLGKASGPSGPTLTAGNQPANGPQFTAPTQEKLYQGLFWAKGHGKKSNNAAYNVKCDTSPNAGIGAMQGNGQQGTPVGGTPSPKPADANAILALAKPDLVIRRVVRVPGNGKALRVLVKNIGKGNANATNMKLFYHRSGKVVVRGATVGPIAGGQSRWVIVQIGSPLAHASKVTLRVDDPNRIAETSEGNNGFVL